MKYDLSICLPAIHTEYWEELYQSLQEACSKHSFELVLIGPYAPSEELGSKDNVKYVKSFASSVRATMEGSIQCEGRLMAVPADDGYFYPESFDQSIDLLDQMNPRDLIVLRYREGKNYKHPRKSGKNSKRLNYWEVRSHPTLNKLGIPLHYKHACQPLLSLEYFREIGGFDCRFEHVAMAAHDLSYRAQRNGSNVHLSPIEVMNADWRPGTPEHIPIEISHNEHDYPLFQAIHRDKGIGNRTVIDFDNWKDAPTVWPRRWPNGVP